MSILDALKQDHETVLQLCATLKKRQENDQEHLKSLCTQLKKEIIIHSKAEDEVFYTRLENESGSGELIDHSREEHETVEKLLHSLDSLALGEKDWYETLEELEKNLAHHIDTEEDKIFKKARGAFTASTLDALEKDFLRAKEKKQESYGF